MLYIVTALKSEAQAFVDYYKNLKKERLNNFIIFRNDKIALIISNLGVSNSRMATQTLIDYFDITDDDIYLNIGICGASKNHEIGTLLSIGSIDYRGINYKIDIEKKHITCLDKEAIDLTYEIVDMESFGFYDAIVHNPAIKKFYIFKVVSDHFEPKSVTKEKTKLLVFNKINSINCIINE